ncbi:DnaJ domain-containing protein [Rhodanobacter sp. DHB23]|uniref:DnaJ domain-containing protein n=1 Tax=Rhodanobacter sp. DHB23 TaxID=2775923 RepID=UPI00177C18EF|nr:DnaJ domain-containing protein [Rhodanobacter sp. DHB23]MBD8872955.1 DnaJ domain-containing protein [Rhodanobacter sp. DHB23]
MTWVHELLGVAADADAATIKRAYARLLRTTRPDEDAEAFQRLNTAYQIALTQAGRQTTRPPMAQPAPIPPPATPKRDTHVIPVSTGDTQPPAAPLHVVVQPSRPAVPLETLRTGPSIAPRAPHVLETLSQPEISGPDLVPPPLETLKPGPSIAPKAAHALETLSPPETSRPGLAPAPVEILKPAGPASTPARVLPPVETLRPAASRPAPAVNIAELAKRVIDEACRAEGPVVLANWLARCPELWSFRIKQLTGQRMMQGLAQESRPMQSANFDALLGFFDLNNVLTGLNPVALEKLRSRLAAHWEMFNDHTSLARRSRTLTEKGQPHPWRVRSCIALLQQPRSWYRTIGVTLTREKSANLARIAHALCLGVPEQLPATLNREHAQFWLRAVGSNGNSREYWTLVAIRVLAMALAGAAITAIVLFWAASQQGDITKPAAWLGIGSVSVVMFAGIALFLSALIGVRWINRWQGAPESSSEANPWRRRLLIPSLCALGLGMDYLLDKPIVATPIVLGALALAIRRYRLRTPKRSRKPILNLSPRALTYLLLACASVIGSVATQAVNGGALDNVPLLAMAAATTLVIWGIDMFRHRAHWRVKQARG